MNETVVFSLSNNKELVEENAILFEDTKEIITEKLLNEKGIAFEELVKRYEVQLVVCGHEHIYSHKKYTYHQIVTHFSKKEYGDSEDTGRVYMTAEVADNDLRVKVFDEKGKIIENFAVK